MADVAAAPEIAPSEPAAAGGSARVALAPTQASSGRSAVGGVGLVGGLQQAHADFVAWWQQPHGGLVDSQLANLDANGVKREFVGYGLAGLATLLLFTSLAPLVANLICIAQPIAASLSVLRGQSTEANPPLVFWSIFGVFSLFDFYAGVSAIYWLFKIAACLVFSLPQTQGAAYALAIEPVANAVARLW